jgi:type I restriction enzyme R subunit
VTRKLQAAILAEGPGSKVPDPAQRRVRQNEFDCLDRPTSWPSCTMPPTRKVFDTVLVVSDRNVIDAQLQEALL